MERKVHDNFTIRSMSRREVDFAVDLAKQEGWNPGLSDTECFYRTDPAGFLIGLSGDRPIGCISAISYQGQFGFLGFYIVIPEFRAKGYGIRLWQSALNKLAGQNIGLDGVIAREADYLKSGFKRAYRNIRFEYKAPGSNAPVMPEIMDIKKIHIDVILQYDRQCFPAERKLFLDCWLKQPGSTALGYLKNNRLEGYGVIRPCFNGYKIGPLFADNAYIAENLYLGLVSRIERGSLVYLDVPEANPQALVLTEKHHMREVFATTRMYNKNQPALALEKVFGVTSFELG